MFSSMRNAVASAVLGLALLPNALAFSPSFPYGSQKVRGVNLGGWLVLEVCNAPRRVQVRRAHSCRQPWITPSLFEATGNNNIVDEYTFGQLQDHNKAYNALKSHWDSFITESDFASIAAAGYVHALETLSNRLIIRVRPADLTMSGCRSATGRSKLVPVNHTCKDSFHTCRRLSTGRPTTVSKVCLDAAEGIEGVLI